MAKIKSKKDKGKKSREVPKEKVELVKSISKLIDENDTLMIASIKGLPARQFQKIKKAISKDVAVIIQKKNILNRAIENSKKGKIKEIKQYLTSDVALLITKLDAFTLSGMLADNQTPVKARAGQVSDVEIEVEAGPTELTAGPVVSELGALGLKIEIKAGKIEIKESKVIVKQGQTISEAAVSIMGKLNIMPFSVGFLPLAAYDSKSDIVYSELTIDKKGTVEKLVNMFSRSKAFAVSLAYPVKETIGFILAKASSHENALAKLIKSEDNAPIQSEENK